MRQAALSRLLDESKRRLDGFDVHGIPSEEYRRAAYSLYEIVKDLHTALIEVEREFEDAYAAFKKIVEKQEAQRARDFIGSIIAEAEDEGKKEKPKAITGNYL